jgi:hypothetical protein
VPPQGVGDVGDLAGVEIRGDLERQRYVFAVLVRQRVSGGT